MQGDQDARNSHNVMCRFLPLVLDSLTSKSHITKKNNINYAVLREQDHQFMSNVILFICEDKSQIAVLRSKTHKSE